MSTKVGIFEPAWERLRERVEALDLDLSIYPFDTEGRFEVDGKKVPATRMELDYLWLAPDMSGTDLPFRVALECARVDVVQTFNAGLDNPAYRKIADRGTRICNSSAQSVAIAEYVLAHALSLIHPIDEQRALQSRGQWQRTPFREVSSTTWLVIGYGPIGREIAKRAKAFGATIDVVRRSPDADEHVDSVGTLADLSRLLPRADVIVLACALNDATRRFAGEAFFGAVKPGAILLNIGRGALIDDAALLAALDHERPAYAVLDVFHPEPLPPGDPYWTHPKVRVTAHTSFAGDGTRARWDQLFLDNLPRYVRGDDLVAEVNPDDIV